VPQRMDSQVLSEDSIKKIRGLKGRYPVRKSAVLMVLHVVHDQFGYLDRAAVREAADLMDLPLIDFEQAASFYTMFPPREVGTYHIQVCRTLSCMLRGSEELVEFLKEKLGIGMGEVTADGLFSLTEVECLGSCGTAPMMQVNDKYYENLTRDRIEKILSDLRKEAGSG
jgi:NADH-quinone oxidoreductase E subunit